jgi:hypothetical protein
MSCEGVVKIAAGCKRVNINLELTLGREIKRFFSILNLPLLALRKNN